MNDIETRSRKNDEHINKNNEYSSVNGVVIFFPRENQIL